MRDAAASSSSDGLADGARRDARAAYGVVPNLFEATNPHTGMPAAVYLAADAALADGLLAPAEQQVVLLELARFFGSRYDAVVHTRMALDAGVPPATVDRVLAGEGAGDARFGPLVEAARRACEERGWLDAEALRDLAARGVSRGKLYEIFALIGLKAFSGFTSHLADVEVDDALKATESKMEVVPEKPDTTKRQRLFLG
jgi:alkylhydroperoxidase family enzyme